MVVNTVHQKASRVSRSPEARAVRPVLWNTQPSLTSTAPAPISLGEKQQTVGTVPTSQGGR